MLCQIHILAFKLSIAQDADSLVEVIKGIVRGKELPFPEKPKDPCDGHLTPGCPVKKGTFYRFKASFEVKPFYPAVSRDNQTSF